MSQGTTTPATPAPQPEQGGSYTRDPVTGELTLVQRTAQAGAEPADDADTTTPTKE